MPLSDHVTPHAAAPANRVRSAGPDRVEVVLLGGDLLFREGLKRLFAETPVRVLGDFAAPAEAAPHATPAPGLRPAIAVVLESAAGPGGWGGIVRDARTAWPAAKIVVLSGRGDAGGLAAAVAAGIDGYLLTAMSPAALVQALNLVVLGENVFPTRLAGGLAAAERMIEPPVRTNGRPLNLTGREIDILHGLLAGKSNKMIANTLGTTDATVKAQLRHLLRKIGAENRTQAALWAREHGLAERASA